MIVFAHLLNDTSGSPKILRSTILAASSAGFPVKLFVGSQGDGFLSGCTISTTRYWYRRSRIRLITLITYLFSQIVLFCRLLNDNSIPRDAIVYVNTLLPFGAALYGKLTGRIVIYHVHETSISPAPLKWLLMRIAKSASQLNIFVSDTHMETMKIDEVRSLRVYNALDEHFMHAAEVHRYQHMQNGVFNVLMIASLRDYKGVPEFIKLAESFVSVKSIRFQLVLNQDPVEVDKYVSSYVIPINVSVFPRTSNTVGFYQQASLLVNLSRVDTCKETFGLTVLEGMSFGIPVIAPPVGGPAELVVDGVQGFLTDSRDLARLYTVIKHLVENPDICMRLSASAKKRAAEFSNVTYRNTIAETLFEMTVGKKSEQRTD